MLKETKITPITTLNHLPIFLMKFPSNIILNYVKILAFEKVAGLSFISDLFDH